MNKGFLTLFCAMALVAVPACKHDKKSSKPKKEKTHHSKKKSEKSAAQTTKNGMEKGAMETGKAAAGMVK